MYSSLKKWVSLVGLLAFGVGLFIPIGVSFASDPKATRVLFEACQKGDPNGVQKALHEGADVNTRDMMGSTPLAFAMQANRRDIMDLLIEKGADINQPVGPDASWSEKDQRVSLLMVAVMMKNTEMVGHLLEKGAKTDITDDKGVPLVCRVTETGDFDLFKSIFDKEGDAQKRYKIEEKETGTLLHIAAAAGHVKIADFLLDHKADIEARASDGYSPLMNAAFCNHLDMVKLLVERGAYIYSSDSYGKSVFEPKESSVSPDIVDYLMQVERDKYPKKPAPAWATYIIRDTQSAEDKPDYISKTQFESMQKYIMRQVRYCKLNLDGLKEYIDKNGIVTGQDDQGNTLLHYVAGAGGKDAYDLLVILLKNKRLPVNAANIRGETPLHEAAKDTNLEMVKELIIQHADVNACNKDGETPLIVTTQEYSGGRSDDENRPAIAKMLLEAGAAVNATDVFGRSALYVIANQDMNHDLDLIKLLLAHGANVDQQSVNGFSPMHIAAQEGKPEIVRLLIEAGGRLDLKDCRNRTPLDAVQTDRSQKLEIMIRYKKDATVIDAAKYDQPAILEKLVQQGAHINTVDKQNNEATGLIIASKKNHDKVVGKFIELGADINIQDKEGNTALHYAAERGHHEVVYLLLSAGADITLRNREGYTALNLAAQNDELRTIQLFKDAYPDVEVTSKPERQEHRDLTIGPSGEIMKDPNEMRKALKEMARKELSQRLQHPLHKAAVQGDLKAIVDILESGKEDVNLYDDNDSTPLMYACCFGDPNMIHLLIDKGAQVNVQNKMGLTPLHIAVSSGEKEMVQVLLSRGADAKLETQNQLNPLEVATLTEHDDIAQMIRKTDPNVAVNLEEWKAQQQTQEDKFKKQLEDQRVQMEQQMKGQENQWKIDQWLEKSGNPFHEAVIEGDIEEVKDQLATGKINVNELDRAGRLALSYAACLGNKEMVDLLLTHGADLNRVDENTWLESAWGFTIGGDGGFGILHYLVDARDTAMVEYFIAKGANPNIKATMDNCITPLFIAASHQNKAMIQILLKAGADPKIADKYGNTIIGEALGRNNLDQFKLLLDLGLVDMNYRDAEGNTLLMTASSTGNVNLMIYLLDKGAAIDAVNLLGENALHLAVRSTNTTECIRTLIEYGIDINHKDRNGNSPLFGLFNFGSGLDDQTKKANIDLLLASGADVTLQNNEGSTLLHGAIESGSLELAARVLQHGAKVNAMDIQGVAPLHMLIDPYHHVIPVNEMDTIKALIKLLIEHGADLTTETHWGWTPLQGAVMCGMPEVVSYMIEKGADVNVHESKKEKRTPLHAALSEHHEETDEVMNILIEHGADINAKDSNDQTPLHYAVNQNKTEIVALLLDAGAKFDIPDKYKRTALDLAKSNRNPKMLSLFQP